jgi:SHS2 domain-containing protein
LECGGLPPPFVRKLACALILTTPIVSVLRRRKLRCAQRARLSCAAASSVEHGGSKLPLSNESALASARARGYNPGVARRFEILEHPADVGFLAYGRDLRELLENAALAMLSLGCALETIEEKLEREIVATGGDDEALLFTWLAEILAAADAEGLVFRRAEIMQLTGGRVRGVARGEPFEKARHRAGTYIKAVTYHQLRIEPAPGGGLRATVYLDV